MKKMLKKILAIMICMLLVGAMIPISVSAKEITIRNYTSGIEVGDTVSTDDFIFTVSSVTVIRETVVVSFELTEYVGQGDEVVTVPDYVTITANDKFDLPIKLGQVTSIGDGAFKETDVGIVDISKTAISYIGEGAFQNSSLQSIIFNENKITQIGDYAFYGTSLKEFYLVSSVLGIVGEHAFESCPNLISVAFLNHTTGIMVPGGFNTFDESQSLVIYSDDANIVNELSQGWTTKLVTYMSNEDPSFTMSVSGTEFTYSAKAITLASKVFDGSNDITSKFEITYTRNGALTEDLISAGIIIVEANGILSEGYAGNITCDVEILPVSAIVIARDKAVDDGEFAIGTATDVIYWGLVGNDVIESVKLTADGDALVPSDVVIKNGELDVSKSYNITYVDGRSFTEKSIESFTKTTEGNVDTYTIEFGDGTTETIVVTNGVDGKDGQDGQNVQDGEAGAQGGTVEDDNGSNALVYASMGIGGVSLLGVIVLLVIVLKKK